MPETPSNFPLVQAPSELSESSPEKETLENASLDSLRSELDTQASHTFITLGERLRVQNGNTRGISFSEELTSPSNLTLSDKKGNAISVIASQKDLSYEICSRMELEMRPFKATLEGLESEKERLINLGQVPPRHQRENATVAFNEISRREKVIKSSQRLVDPAQRLRDLQDAYKRKKTQKARQDRAAYYENKNHRS